MSELKFLNIDLEIESNHDISSIVNEWGERVIVLNHEEVKGTYYGAFETEYGGINEIVEEYLSLVDSLTDHSRRIWNQANLRNFDFGYEVGSSPKNLQSKIDSSSIEKIAKVGGNIVITIYPAENT